MISKTPRKTPWLALFFVPAVLPVAGITAHAAPKPKVAHKKAATKPTVKALFDAINKGDLHAVQSLLARGANVNAHEPEGYTPLMAAVLDAPITALLLQKGANANAQDAQKDTALLIAAAAGEIKTARLLLNAGANANAQDAMGYTPLLHAVLSSVNSEGAGFVQLLLDHGADPNLNGQTESPLENAAGLGEKKAVELLLTRGTSHPTHEVILNALMAVLQSGQMQLAQPAIYAYGATLSENQKATILTEAKANDTAIVQTLLNHGADISQISDNSALIYAATNGVASIVQLMLDKGAPVNGSGSDGITPLMAAAENGNEDVCKLLLNAGANPNLKDTDGKTALMHLAEKGRNNTARNLPTMRKTILDRENEDSDAPTSPEVKPAEAAIWQKWADDGDAAIIGDLLAKKADPQARDKQGQTALMIATATSSVAVVSALKQAGTP